MTDVNHDVTASLASDAGSPAHIGHGLGFDGFIPETRVLAIASHVTYGYVGNTMATFVMQCLGCEVAAINTVHFSNHTGYRQFKGTKTPAAEINELYDGLKASNLTDFDVLLSGYIPSAETLAAVRSIAHDLRVRSKPKPGSFFWVLDPVMGDQGKLYVSEELVAGYRETVSEADLILPNQFELQVLTGIDIGDETKGADLKKVAEALNVLHKEHGVNHVIVTSIRMKTKEGILCVVGSSAKSNRECRIFMVEVPMLDCFFSGTGDMFAALMVGRLRQACMKAGTLGRHGWVSDDDVESTELPLAKATCQVLSSMQMVLEKTMSVRDKEVERWRNGEGANKAAQGEDQMDEDFMKREYLAKTKAAEVRVVKNAKDLLFPENKYTVLAFEQV